MFFPHVPVKGSLHFICFRAHPTLKLLFFWFLDPLWIMWTGHKMALQAPLVSEGFLAGSTVEGFPLVRRLMGSQLGFFQELPSTHIVLFILEGADVFLCLRIMCLLMLLQGRAVSIIFQTGWTSIWGLLQVFGPDMVPEVLGSTV